MVAFAIPLTLMVWNPYVFILVLFAPVAILVFWMLGHTILDAYGYYDEDGEEQ